MAESEEVRNLMAKLMAAVEASLSDSSEVRDVLAELVRSGYEPRLYFVANAESGPDPQIEGTAELDDADDEDDDDAGEAPPRGLVLRELARFGDSDLTAELTKLDRDFLRSLRIRPEPGQ